METRMKVVLASVLLAGASLSFAATSLKGSYTPGDEGALIKQLAPQGFEYFNSYQRNPDGSAVIKAIDVRGNVEPIATISIAKDGLAVVTDNDANPQHATKHD